MTSHKTNNQQKEEEEDEEIPGLPILAEHGEQR